MRPSASGAAWAALAAVSTLSLCATVGGATIDRGLDVLVGAVPGGDFTGHLILMGGCSFFAVRGFASAPYRGRPLGAVRVTAALLALSLLEEGSQHWLAARTCSWSDALANTVGIVTFGLLAGATVRPSLRSTR